GAQVMRTFSVVRPVGTERLLHVTLDFRGGSVLLLPAASGQLYNMRLRYDPDRYAPVQQYDPRTGILRLGLQSVGGTGLRVMSSSQLEQLARFELAADVPLALSATLDASDATIDLGGTMLTQLDIESGATHATVDFSRPTRGACKSATFTVGASQLEVLHLAQAACAEVRVDGGAGSTTLGFQGAWRRDIVVTVDLALGGLVLQIPRGTGVHIAGQRFLAPFDRRGLVQSGDGWQTPGFERAAHKLDVDLKASITSIAIDWQ
ncbi:MAG: hypothetical protein ACREK8_00965, partial [Gemmatimonadales bacterium]